MLFRSLTTRALLEELPRIIGERYPNGVTHKDLYAVIANETPADMQLQAEAVNLLCAAGELYKTGVDGEARAHFTTVKDRDLIRLTHQFHLFKR